MLKDSIAVGMASHGFNSSKWRKFCEKLFSHTPQKVRKVAGSKLIILASGSGGGGGASLKTIPTIFPDMQQRFAFKPFRPKISPSGIFIIFIRYLFCKSLKK